MRFLLFLLGYGEVVLSLDTAGVFLELCRVRHFRPYLMKKRADGALRCRFFAFSIPRLFEAAAEAGVHLQVSYGGVPVAALTLWRRKGLLLGLMLALVLTTFSRFFLWSVEITGNKVLTEEELHEALAACGLRTGSFLPGLDTDAVSAALRQGEDRISYVGINLVGTVAKVQIREAVTEEEKNPVGPANLVAARDGVITLPLIFEGKCLVREGEVVRKGQILAGGVIDTQNNGVRITRAAGEVWARTTHVFTVRMPFSYEEKAYTGRVGREISLLFFSLDRKVLKTTGKIAGKCDIIEEIKQPWIGDRKLPVGLAHVQYREYELKMATRTVEEACRLAMKDLNAILYAKSATCRLLSRQIEVQTDGEGVTLICTVETEENIARTVELSLGK